MITFATRKLDVTNYATANNVKLYEIAHKVGCNDGNLSRKLRYMEDSDVAYFKGVIDQIVSERGMNNAEG